MRTAAGDDERAAARSRRGGFCPPLLLGLVAACASQPKKPGPIVKDIEIRGAEAISPSAIKKRIATTETGWWPFATKHHFDPIEWQADLKRIERYYETRGYYGAQVTNAEVKPQEKADEVKLLVDVAESGPAKIASVDLQGLEVLSDEDREEVLYDLPLVVGEVFLEGRWAEAKALVARRLRDRGHAEADVQGEAIVDRALGKADLKLVVVPGPVYRFGEIQVQTQQGATVEPWRVWEQVQLAIGRDRVYSEEDIEEAQRRVFGMGVFAAARVTPGPADPATGRIPVIVDVREGPFHTLRLGGGVGIDQVRQDARLLAQWTDRNWLGGLRTLNLRAIAGWAFLPSTLEVLRDRSDEGPKNGPIYQVTAELEQPRFLGRPSLRYRSLLESERTLEPTYTSIGGRAENGIVWQPYSTLTLAPSYHLEVYWLEGPNVATAESAPLALGCKTDPCTVVLSFLEQTIAWDKRSSPLEPRRGHYLSLGLQEGGGPLQGDFSYLRILPEARIYTSFGEDDLFTIGARLRLGTLLTSSGRADDSAAITRFYGGGSNSMRGFGIRRMSPLLLVPVNPRELNSPLIALPIGGNGLVEGNVELRARAGESLLVAAFLDFGNVSRERLAPDDLRHVLWAPGVGLRYLSPVGPIRFDFAFRLPYGRPPPLFNVMGEEITYERRPSGVPVKGRETGEHVNTSCFGIGGSEKSTWVRDGLCAFHISIGEAF
jgi:translocation and assembly module TamA